MPWTKALSDADEQRLIVDHEDGFGPRALARRYKVSESTVHRILADAQVPMVGRVHNARRRALRASGKGRVLQPCGTNAAYVRHKRNGEYPCIPCLDAHNLDDKIRREAKKHGDLSTSAESS